MWYQWVGFKGRVRLPLYDGYAGYDGGGGGGKGEEEEEEEGKVLWRMPLWEEEIIVPVWFVYVSFFNYFFHLRNRVITFCCNDT